MCSHRHQSLFQFPPSIWWAAVAVLQRNPSGNVLAVDMAGNVAAEGVCEDGRMSQEAVDDLVKLLDLEPIEVNIFRGCRPTRSASGCSAARSRARRSWRPPARSSRAATSTRCTPTSCGRAIPTVPILYEVDRIRDGRSFTTRRVVAIQHGKAIFNLQSSFQVPEDGLEHQEPMPESPLPETLPDFQERLGPYKEAFGDYYYRPRPIDTRHVDWNPPDRKDPLPPYQRVWMRADGTLPDDPVLHACVLTYASDMTLLDTALLPHGGSWRSDGLFMASLDHAMWFHRPFRADEWLLYSQDTPSASEGRGLGRGIDLHGRRTPRRHRGARGPDPRDPAVNRAGGCRALAAAALVVALPGRRPAAATTGMPPTRRRRRAPRRPWPHPTPPSRTSTSTPSWSPRSTRPSRWPPGPARTTCSWRSRPAACAASR